MITTLCAGKLHGPPVERTSRDGKHRFVTGKMRCAQEGGDALFINLTCFSDTAKAGLLALDEGDACSVVGILTITVWTDAQGHARPQASVLVDRVESPYSVERKRRAARGEGTEAGLVERTARTEPPRHASAQAGKTTTRKKREPIPSGDFVDDDL
ncbi:single-stranded DNA-binding protein [Paraburkholderia sp. RL18-103-BIB-C]|uniref:single-stranded DNA-binding protein n=1 Tax=Paraburkholderia sp. RL18-103-BIB-C TaxID=3031637 RepID=UPI0038B91C25